MNQAKNTRQLLLSNYANKLTKLDIDGSFADKEILKYVVNNGSGIVATLDKNLKSRIKSCGGSIISLSNDCIILES